MFLNGKINNEEEAYILGLFYADGNVSKNKDKNGNFKYASIGLAEIDYEYLKSIEDIFLKSKIQTKISNVPTTKSFKLSITDAHVVETLNLLGVIPNKTYDSKDSCVFDNVPNEFKHHFIRGYFDGDGTICLTNEKKFVSGFVGMNLCLLEEIQKWLNMNGLKSLTKIRIEKEKYYRLYFSGNAICKRLGEIIYKDSSIFLHRKKNIFDSITITDKTKHKSIYTGISPKQNKNGIVWTSNCCGKYLGCFKTEEEAVKKRNKYIIDNNITKADIQVYVKEGI